MAHPALKVVCAVAIVVAGASMAVPSAAQAPAARSLSDVEERQAQTVLESALHFLAKKDYKNAVEDLQRVLDPKNPAYLHSAAAAVASFRLAEYYFEVRHDPAAANNTLKILFDYHPGTSWASRGYVLSARIKWALIGKPSGTDVSSWTISDAQADLDRAVRPFQGQYREEVAEARYFQAEIQRWAGKMADALARYREVSVGYPTMIWGARALLGEARCLVALGNGARALDLLQRVRDRYPDTPEAAQALGWNTIIYRLYLRVGGGVPAYEIDPKRSFSLKKPVDAVAFDKDGVLHVAGGDRHLELDTASGRVTKSDQLPGLQGLAVDGDGRVTVVQQAELLSEQGGRIEFNASAGAEAPKPLHDILAAAFTSQGDILVSDNGPKSVTRYPFDGKTPLGRFAAGVADRIVVDYRDQVATLDGRSKSVAIHSNAGDVIARLQPPVVSLDKPVDIAFDPLGHLYILDRESGRMFVYSPADWGKTLTSFIVRGVREKETAPSRKATAFGLDAFGRVFIYDERAEEMLVYR